MSTTHYDVIERIAVGGMAEIYLGVARGLEGFSRPVVIKKVRPRLSNDQRFVQMLIKEAKITAALNHPNIVQILDLGRNAEDEHFIVMEYVDGQDLRSLIDEASAKEQAISRELAVFIASEVCAALDHAHRQTDEAGRPLNLIHRDVSPSNVLVSFAGEVKLTDFGIARYGRDVSVIGTLKGKLAYMSPEQARGKTVDHRSDLYSLGSILFEIVLGRRVYQAETDLEMLEHVREGQVPLPSSIVPEIPLELEQILLRALAPNPAQRFQSAEEMGLALREHLFRSTQPAGPKELATLLRELFPIRRTTSQRDGVKFLVTSSIAGFQCVVDEPPDDFEEEQNTSVSAPPANLLHSMRSREDFDHSERTPVVEAPPDLRAGARLQRSGPIQEIATNRAFFGSSSEEEVLRIITSIPSLDDLEPITDEDSNPSTTPDSGAAVDLEITGVALQEASIGDLDLEATGIAPRSTGELLREVTQESPLEELEVEVMPEAEALSTSPAAEAPGERAVTSPHAAARPRPSGASRPAPEPAVQPRPGILAARREALAHAALPSAAAPLAPSAPPRAVISAGPLPDALADPTGPVALPRGAPHARPPDPVEPASRPIAPATSTGPLAPPASARAALDDAESEPRAPAVVPRAEGSRARDGLAGRPPRARRRLAPVLMVSLLGLGLGSTAAWIYLRGGSLGAILRPATRDSRALPNPSDAGHTTSSARLDATPVHDAGAVAKPRAADLRVGSRAMRTDARARPDARKRVVIVRPPPKLAGQLVIKSEPWAYIHVDGRNTRRTTSATPFSIPAGTHRIDLVNPALKLRTSFTVKIGVGETVRKFVHLE